MAADCWRSVRLTRALNDTEASRLAQHLRDQAGHNDAPLTCLDALCLARGITIERKRLRAAAGGLQGLLIPDVETPRFRLVVDDDVPGGGDTLPDGLRVAVRRHRERFVIAHELAHSFFYAWSSGRARRSVPDGPEQESFCDAFARALLVPSRVVEATEPTAQNILCIQRRFDVSMQVAARAVEAVHGATLFVALLLHSPNGSVDVCRPQWRPAGDTPSKRWWADGLVTEAMRHGHARGSLQWSAGRSTPAEVKYLPERRQALLVAARPRAAGNR